MKKVIKEATSAALQTIVASTEAEKDFLLKAQADYKKAHQRRTFTFVDTGEFRVPKINEWFYSGDANGATRWFQALPYGNGTGKYQIYNLVETTTEI